MMRGDTCGYRTKRLGSLCQCTLPSLPYLDMVLSVWLLRLHEPLEQTISRAKKGEQVHITWLGVGRRVALLAGQPNRSESLLARCQHDARSRRFMVSSTREDVASSKSRFKQHGLVHLPLSILATHP